MSLCSKSRIVAIVATALAFFAGISGASNAAWEKVQDSPAVYRDTRTNLEWTVTLGSVCSNAQAQSLVQKYGFRLPTPSELQYVINCNYAACQLCLYDGHRTAYETSNPCTLVSVRHGCARIVSRRSCKCTYVVGVRDGNFTDLFDQVNYSPSQSIENVEEKLDADVGKLYVLSVWGTNDEKTGPTCKRFEQTFNSSMNKAGLTRTNNKGNFVAEYKTLDGDNASKDNIIENCRSIHQKAGKDDVIFVYINCHGDTRRLKKEDQERQHILYPQMKYSTDINENFDKFALLRSDIINALSPNDHRFVVLITDTCASLFETKVKSLVENVADDPAPACEAGSNNNAACDPVPQNTDSLFRIFLRTNKGFVNWNSASPVGGVNNQGENSWESLINNTACGTFFNPFVYFINYQEIVDLRISTSYYFNRLKSATAENFVQLKKRGLMLKYSILPEDKSNIKKIKKDLMSIESDQATQTVYDFGDSGTVREDKNRDWENEDEEEDSSGNDQKQDENADDEDKTSDNEQKQDDNGDENTEEAVEEVIPETDDLQTEETNPETKKADDGSKADATVKENNPIEDEVKPDQPKKKDGVEY